MLYNLLIAQRNNEFRYYTIYQNINKIVLEKIIIYEIVEYLTMFKEIDINYIDIKEIRQEVKNFINGFKFNNGYEYYFYNNLDFFVYPSNVEKIEILER